MNALETVATVILVVFIAAGIALELRGKDSDA